MMELAINWVLFILWTALVYWMGGKDAIQSRAEERKTSLRKW